MGTILFSVKNIRSRMTMNSILRLSQNMTSMVLIRTRIYLVISCGKSFTMLVRKTPRNKKHTNNKKSIETRIFYIAALSLTGKNNNKPLCRDYELVYELGATFESIWWARYIIARWRLVELMKQEVWRTSVIIAWPIRGQFQIRAIFLGAH